MNITYNYWDLLTSATLSTTMSISTASVESTFVVQNNYYITTSKGDIYYVNNPSISYDTSFTTEIFYKNTFLSGTLNINQSSILSIIGPVSGYYSVVTLSGKEYGTADDMSGINL